MRVPGGFTLVLLLSLAAGGARGAQDPSAVGTPLAEPERAPHAEVAALLDRAAQALSGSGPATAVPLLTRAADRARALDDRIGEALARLWLGRAARLRGAPQQALDHYTIAVRLFREAGDRRSEATVLHNIGVLQATTGELQAATKTLAQALVMRRDVADRGGQAATLTELGAVHQNLGETNRALDCLREALPLARSAANRSVEATALNNIGAVYGSQGRPQEAAQSYQRALALLRTLGDRAAEATTLNNVGAIYAATGQLQQARALYEQSLELLRAAGDRRGEASALTNLGRVADRSGEPRQALGHYEAALGLFRAAGDRRGEATVLTNIGRTHAALKAAGKALEYYQEALTLRRASGDRGGEAATLTEMGRVYRETAERQKALECFRQALPLYQSAADRVGEAVTLTQIGMSHQAAGEAKQALESYRAATELSEQMRERLGGNVDAQQGVLADRLALYHLYIDLLIREGRTTEAFARLQSCKARTLLDLMSAGRVQIDRSLTGEEREQERRLVSQASQLNRRFTAAALRAGADPEGFAAARLDLGRAERELQAFRDALYARHPDLARRRAARTLTLADTAAWLPPDTALLEYVVLDSPEVNRALLFCVTVEKGKPVLRTYPIRATPEQLGARSRELRNICADPRRSYEPAARGSYRLLVGPAENQLSGKTRLLICPDGGLWGMPFQVLLAPEREPAPLASLLHRYEVAYAFSATAAAAAVQRPRLRRPTRTLLAVAHPEYGGAGRFGQPQAPREEPAPGEDRPIAVDARPIAVDARTSKPAGINPLPGTQVEAEALRTDYPAPEGVFFLQKEAQETAVKREAGKYRFLHFATHGFLNSTSPLQSSIVLAAPPEGSDEDGFLTAREIAELDLCAEVAVLSACDTGRGEIRRGEGIVGLTWALFVAGARSQVVSQWAVSDSVTPELMRRFYAGLKAGSTKSAALRAAAGALSSDGKHAHPYYWAPFVLIGDWR